MPPVPLSCASAEALGFVRAGEFTVAADGLYSLADAGELVARDVVISIHTGSFNPGNPEANRIALVDGGAQLALEAGQNYEMVVQQTCKNLAGVYAIGLTGPGDISSTRVVNTPAWRSGSINAQTSQADFGYGKVAYTASPPVQVSQTGLYRIADLGVLTGLDTVVHIYHGTFDAQNPNSGRIASVDDGGSVLLEAGVNYRFVASVAVPGATGNWRFEMFPPGDMQINPGLNGAWFNPATNGQGVLMEIYPDIQLVFIAWFTFDLEQPPSGEEALLGAPGQRWLTGSGTYHSGASSLELDVQLTSGGVFDDAPPLANTETGYGTVTLEFADCKTAMLDYDLSTGPVSGQIALQRIAADNVDLCAELTDGPGVISQ